MCRTLLWFAFAGCGRIGFDSDGATADALPQLGFAFPDFVSCPNSLVFTGDAQCANGSIVINPDANDRQGAVYFATPFAITPQTTIATHVVFQFPDASPSPPGDGVVIVIHGDPRGPMALGGGAGLGVGGIVPSLGVELDTFKDTFDPDANHIGIDRDGDDSSIVTSMLPFAMNDNQFHVWVDYDAGTLRGSAAPTDVKPNQAQVMLADDLARLGSTVWIGIVGGTAFAAEGHVVLAWQLAVTL